MPSTHLAWYHDNRRLIKPAEVLSMELFAK
jgi:hypothetical protein